MFLYANIEGIGGDGRYVPIGLAMGSQENCMLALDELMRVTGGETSRILPGHEKLLWGRHRLHRYPDGLHIAEVCLRPGDATCFRTGTTPAGRAVTAGELGGVRRDLHATYQLVVSAEGMSCEPMAGSASSTRSAGRGPWYSGTGYARSPTRSPGTAPRSAFATARRSPIRGRSSWPRRWWR